VTIDTNDDNLEGEGGGEPSPSSSLPEKIRALSKLQDVDVMAEGFKALILLYVAKAQEGDISPQEGAILRNMLKDSGMVWGSPVYEAVKQRQALLNGNAPGAQPELTALPPSKSQGQPAPLPDLGNPDYLTDNPTSAQDE
jgi:hypothetical protein